MQIDFRTHTVKEPPPLKERIKWMDLPVLERKLKEAIKAEEYEDACYIRDEINSRSNELSNTNRR